MIFPSPFLPWNCSHSVCFELLTFIICSVFVHHQNTYLSYCQTPIAFSPPILLLFFKWDIEIL